MECKREAFEEIGLDAAALEVIDNCLKGDTLTLKANTDNFRRFGDDEDNAEDDLEEAEEEIDIIL